MSMTLRLLQAQAFAPVFDEFSFLHWQRIGLLLLVGVAVFAYVWGAHQRRRTLESLGHSPLVERLVASVHRRARMARSALLVTSLVALTFALMRPQYGGVAQVETSSGLDIVLVVDYSKSMLAEDIYPSRSQRIEAELSHFLEDARRRGDRVGLVIFAGAARGLPVTSDLSLLELYLQKADPKTEEPGGTAIGKALTMAVDFLVESRRDASSSSSEQEAEGDQAIILLTDGEDTVSRPVDVAMKAAELGIHIYSVGIGSLSGEPVLKFDEAGKQVGYQTDESGSYVLTRLDEETLKELAEISQGAYVRVDPKNFSLDALRSTFTGLSRAKRESTVQIYRQEGFALLVFPALLLLSISLAMGDRKRKIG